MQRNLTDYDSRIMRLAGGNWGQCYNAQAVVDSKNQIIVVSDLTNQGNDQRQLVPMLSQVEAVTGRKPKVGIADAGYFSNESISATSLKDIDLVVPADRKDRIYKRGMLAFTPSDTMREKLQKPEYKAIYQLRKLTVEPVFGQIKASVLAFKQFSFRGLGKVKAEWKLVCTAHNIMKLFRSTWRPAI